MDPIEEIKNKLNIVDVIGEYVKLQKAGKNWRGLCPFHHEKTPSFYVSEEKQLWHCFGCGKGGGIFDFIMQIENITFPEALKILADKAGIKLKKISFRDQSQKEKIYEINNKASLFFQKNLFSKRGERALEYLKKRGLSEKTIKEFRLGFALDEWHSLENYLKEIGFKNQDLILAGLVSQSKQKIFDRFRSRIMFPFFNLSGKIAGFTGRIFNKENKGAGKYVNTPETLVFNKSNLIYGLFHSKDYIKKWDKVLIVEGQMDFLTAWEKGIKFVLATSGTAFSDSQLKIISRYSKNMLLCFDMDEAGQVASERIIPLALKFNFKIEVLTLLREKDLADFLLKAKNEEIKNIFKSAVPVIDFYFKRAFSLGDKKTIEGKNKIANFFLDKIKNLPSPIEQGVWIERLANELQLKEEYLYPVLKKIKVTNTATKKEDVGGLEEKKQFFLPKNRWEVLGQKMISLVLINKSRFLPIVKAEINKKYFLPKNILLALNALEGKKVNKEIDNFLAYLDLRNSYVFSQENKKFDFEKELRGLLKEIKKEYFKTKIEELNFSLKQLDTKNKRKEAEEIVQKINKYLLELKKIE